MPTPGLPGYGGPPFTDSRGVTYYKQNGMWIGSGHPTLGKVRVTDPNQIARLNQEYNAYLSSNGSGSAALEDHQQTLATQAENVPQPVEANPAQRAEDVFGFGPGAASIQENLRPNVPTARQLAEALSSVQSNDPAETVRAVERVTQQLHQGKSAFQRAWATVGNIAKAMKRVIWDPPTVTNYDRIEGEWDTSRQIADHWIRNLGNAAERAVPNLRRQEAIYNYAAAGGDRKLLTELAQTQPEDVRRGYSDALTLTPDEETIANQIRSAYDEFLQRGVENGLLGEGAEDYMKRVVVKRPEVQDAAVQSLRQVSGAFRTNFPEARRRYWREMWDAERNGVRYDKRIRGISLYAQSFESVLANRKFIRQLAEGETESGRPLAITGGSAYMPIPDSEVQAPLYVRPYGVRTIRGATALAREIKARNPSYSDAGAMGIAKGQILQEYRKIDNPAFRNWQWVQTLPDGRQVYVSGDMLVHKSIFNKLNRGFATKRWDMLDAPIRVKQYITGSKLSLSAFHGLHESNIAAGHLVNPGHLRPLDEYIDNPVIQDGMRAGLKLVGNAREQTYFAEGAGNHGWPEQIPYGGRILKMLKDSMFEDWIPRMKAEAYLGAYERNRGRVLFRGLTDEQVRYITAKEINASFGEQNYRRMMMDPRLHQMLQLFLVSPDFTMSKLQHLGQAFTRFGGEQRMSIGIVAAGLYLLARVLNQAINGDPDWDWHDAFAVKVGNRRYTMRSLPGDLIRLIQEPFQYGMNRLSFFPQSLIETLYKRDPRTGLAVDYSDIVKDFFLQGVPIPLTWRHGIQIKDQLAETMGLTPMQPRTAVTRMLENANAFREQAAKNNPKIAAEVARARAEAYLPPDYQLLNRYLRDNDVARAQNEILRLMQDKGKTPLDVSRYYLHLANKPFTGSRQLDTAWIASMTPADRQLWRQAIQERMQMTQTFYRAFPGALQQYRGTTVTPRPVAPYVVPTR